METQKNAAYYIAMQAGRTPLGTSWPGCAKTASIMAFAKATNRKLYVLIGSIREPSDFGIPFLQDAKVIAKTSHESQHGIAHFVLAAPKWAADTFDGDKWIICLDELKCCPPAVQAGMLRLVAENWVGDLEMPSDLWKCALTNPTELATNGFELEPALANRMVHLPWEMDWSTWDDGMAAGGNFATPRIPIVPDDWQKEKPAIGGLFQAFRHHRPSAFFPDTDINGEVTMERVAMSGAWPSPRSWEIAMDCRAAAIASGADRTVQANLMHGCVGAVAHEFMEWESNLDLPDPEEMLQKACAAIRSGDPVPYVHPDRGDKVVAMLGAIANRVVGDRDDKARYNKERWEAAATLFHCAGKEDMALAIICMFRLYRCGGEIVKPADAVLPPAALQDMFPLFRSVL